MVNLASTTTSNLITKGISKSPQPILVTMERSITGSTTCSILQIAYDSSSKSLVDLLETSGAGVLTAISYYTSEPDPRGGDLRTDVKTITVGKVPSYCFDVVVSTK